MWLVAVFLLDNGLDTLIRNWEREERERDVITYIPLRGICRREGWRPTGNVVRGLSFRALKRRMEPSIYHREMKRSTKLTDAIRAMKEIRIVSLRYHFQIQLKTHHSQRKLWGKYLKSLLQFFFFQNPGGHYKLVFPTLGENLPTARNSVL